MLKVAVNSDNFTTPKRLKPIYGSAANYTPSGAQSSLIGQEVYRDSLLTDAVNAANSVQGYQFVLSNSLGNFNVGEIILLDETDNICAIVVNDLALTKRANANGVQGNTITFNVFFDFSTGVAVAFGDSQSSDAPLSIPSVTSIENLPSAVSTSTQTAGSAGNFYLTTSPFVTGNTQESLSCLLTGGQGSAFASWSFSAYQLLNQGFLALRQVTPYTVTLDILLPNLVQPGQFILQLAGIVRIVQSFTTVTLGNGVTVSELTFANPIDTSGILPSTTNPTLTPYKLHTAVSLSTQFLQFFQGLTVSAEQVNEAALANATLYLRSDGTVPFISNVDANQFKLLNVADPALAQDAVNLRTLQQTNQLLNLQLLALANRLTSLEATVQGLLT